MRSIDKICCLYEFVTMQDNYRIIIRLTLTFRNGRVLDMFALWAKLICRWLNVITHFVLVVYTCSLLLTSSDLLDRVICLCILFKKNVITTFGVNESKQYEGLYPYVSLRCLISDLVITRPGYDEVILLVPAISLYLEYTVCHRQWLSF